eukprot:405784-Pyramimonas_sp.AAC.2
MVTEEVPAEQAANKKGKAPCMGFRGTSSRTDLGGRGSIMRVSVDDPQVRCRHDCDDDGDYDDDDGDDDEDDGYYNDDDAGDAVDDDGDGADDEDVVNHDDAADGDDDEDDDDRREDGSTTTMTWRKF